MMQYTTKQVAELLEVPANRVLYYVNKGMLESELKNPNKKGGANNIRIITDEHISQFNKLYNKINRSGRVSYTPVKSSDLDTTYDVMDSPSELKVYTIPTISDNIFSKNTKLTDLVKVTIVDEIVFKSFIERLQARLSIIMELNEMTIYMNDICQSILQSTDSNNTFNIRNILELLTKLDEIEPKYEKLIQSLL